MTPKTTPLPAARAAACAAACAAALAAVAAASAFAAADAHALRQRHAALEGEMAKSPFQRPLVLHSDGATPQTPQGDVYAVVDHPYAAVKAALARPAQWCDVMILQSNIKRCAPSAQGLQVAVGRKFDQPANDAFVVEFRWAQRAASDEHLSVQLAAETGPVGTRNYRLAFQAVPIDARRTFVHMRYTYEPGLAARLATDAYLATSGRGKVGFSRGDAGLVGGIQGVAERNTMRYFLAIEAHLAAQQAPEGQRAEQRLRDFFAATERYPRQLREMTQDQYMTLKRRDVQQMRQIAAAPAARDDGS